MILQILVPRHNESENVLKHLFNSIAIQENISFSSIGVIICDDGSETKLSDDFLISYPFNIQYAYIEHSGVSAARQMCLNLAIADYVMFCDADDMFCNSVGLWYIFQQIKELDFNFLISEFIEETRDIEGNIAYINVQNDDTYIHGKIFKRSWLLKNNIKWDSSLTIHEDSYFVALAKVYGDEDPNRMVYCSFPFYLWRWTPESVCHKDMENYAVKTFVRLIDSNTALIKELFRRGKENYAPYYCASLVLTAYYYSNTENFLDKKNKKYVEEINCAFLKYYKEFGYIFENMDSQMRKEVGNSIRSILVEDQVNKFSYETFTLQQWLRSIIEKR